MWKEKIAKLDIYYECLTLILRRAATLRRDVEIMRYDSSETSITDFGLSRSHDGPSWFLQFQDHGIRRLTGQQRFSNYEVIEFEDFDFV